ncbi:MAG: hypothetical protein ACLUAR_12480 [Pilosibacter sp.]
MQEQDPSEHFSALLLPLAMPGIAVGGAFTFLGSLEECTGNPSCRFPGGKTMPVELYGVIVWNIL